MSLEGEKAKFFLERNNANEYFTYIDNPIPLVDRGEKLETGWYFSDETWTNFIGPYTTFDECFENFHEYCKGLK